MAKLGAALGPERVIGALGPVAVLAGLDPNIEKERVKFAIDFDIDETRPRCATPVDFALLLDESGSIVPPTGPSGASVASEHRTPLGERRGVPGKAPAFHDREYAGVDPQAPRV